MANWAIDQLRPELQAQARAKLAGMQKRTVLKLNASAPVPDERGWPPPVKSKPSKTTEHAEQCAVIDWWKSVHGGYRLPEFALYAVPNAAKRSPRAGAAMKAEGLRPGMLDLHLDTARFGSHGLRIEMKLPPNKLTEEQQKVIDYYISEKYVATVCWSAEEAIKVIRGYLEV